MPDTICKLAVGLCVIAITIRWMINSYRNPGGILHGARWMLSLTNLSIWLGLGPKITTSIGDECRLGYEEPLEAVRTVFGGIGTTVYGWPSTGGLWVHEQCYGIELNFLGLSRFEPSATQRFSKEEDEFCERLEKIGGRFYENESAYASYMGSLSYGRFAQMWYGWPDAVPDGGVWALQTKGFEVAEKGISRIRNALSMDERCRAIEMLGGHFYEKWDDVAKGEAGAERKDTL